MWGLIALSTLTFFLLIILGAYVLHNIENLKGKMLDLKLEIAALKACHNSLCESWNKLDSEINSVRITANILLDKEEAREPNCRKCGQIKKVD